MRLLVTACVLAILLSGLGVKLRQSHAAEPAPATREPTVVDVIAPSGLQVRSAANVPRVDLSWTDNVDGEAGFLIERSEDGGKTFTEAARIRADSTGHIDHIVTRDTAYSYRVRAIGPDWATKPTTAPAVRTADFQVFDAMLFEPKPDLRRTGMDAIYVGYAREFSATNAATYDHASEAATRAVARRAARHGILVIDIEHWPVDIRKHPREEVSASLEKLATLADWIRDERPDVKLGFYGIMPIRDYWTPVSLLTARQHPGTARHAKNLPQFQAEYDEWVRANELVRDSLAEKVDFLFPSLYTFYDDADGWRLYAEANLREARKAGKPMYPFLWMSFHGSNGELDLKLLPGALWREELQAMRELADGVVIWGGWQRKWHPAASWWRAMREFLNAGKEPVAMP